MNKGVLTICAGVFGFIGAYLPMLFGDDGLGIWSVLGSVIGGLFGIWVGVKLSKTMG